MKEHIARAATAIAELERPEAAAAVSAQRLAAKQRAAAERHTRLLLGLAELEKIRVGKTKAEQAQARVSMTDPEARVMKDGHGGFASSYNLQLTNACAYQSKCCPKSGHRSVKVSHPNPVVAAFAESMKEEKNKELYQQRGPVAEFPTRGSKPNTSCVSFTSAD